MGPAADAGLVDQGRNVARAIADHRQRFLAQRRDHKLARFSIRQSIESFRIDDLEQKMILPTVQSILRRVALTSDAGSDNFGQSIEIDRFDAQTRLQFTAQRLAPGLGTEDAAAHWTLAQVGVAHRTSAPKSCNSVT